MKTLLLTLIATSALKSALFGGDFYISPNGSGNYSGYTNANKPYFTNEYPVPTAVEFDMLFLDRTNTVIPINTTIHFLPGTYETLEGITLKQGWQLLGSGIDVTTVRLGNSPYPWTAAIGGSGNGGWNNFFYYSHPSGIWCKDNVTVSDMTIDLNLVNQTACLSPTAIGLSGNNQRVSRVKVINWGSATPINPQTGNGAEEFIVAIISHPLNQDIQRNAVIEDCVLGPAASRINTDGVSAFFIGAQSLTPGPGWRDGGEIRRCAVSNIVTSFPAGLASPKYFTAFSACGGNMKIRSNIATNLSGGTARAVYFEQASVANFLIENNQFLDVAFGICFTAYDMPCADDTTMENVRIRNNIITLKPDGYGIYIGGYANARWDGVAINDNQIVAKNGSSSFRGIILDDADGVTVNDNKIDSNGGDAIWFDPSTKGTISGNLKSNGSLITLSGTANASSMDVMHPVTVSITNISVKTAGTYPLLAVPPGRKFVTVAADVETTAKSGTPTSGAVVSLGDSVQPACIVTNRSLFLNSFVGSYQTLTNRIYSGVITGTNTLVFRVITPSVGGTSQSVSVHVTGYYR